MRTLLRLFAGRRGAFAGRSGIFAGKSGPLAASALPATGLIGAWYGDRYSATPRPYLPNSAVPASAAPTNILSAPRRQFACAAFYSVVSATVTDSNASAADGTNDATTIVWGSVDGYVQSTIAAELPNATYTLSVDVATTDASTVSFRMGPNASMTTKSATPTWQTFSVTFVSSGAPNMFIVRSVNSVTPANLKIINARLHPGSVDLGVDATVGNLLLGSNAYANLPSVASAVMDTVAGGYGVIQMPAANVGSSFTVIVVGKRTGTTGNVVQPFISKLAGSSATAYQQFAGLYGNGQDSSTAVGGTMDMWVGATEMFGGYRPGLWSPTIGLWESISCRYDGTTANIFMNDSKMPGVTSAGKTFSAADFIFNRYTVVGGTSAKQAAFAIAYWNRALTDSEVVQAVAYLKARALLNSIAVNVQPRFLCPEGDSITFGVNASYGYPDIFAPNASPSAIGINRAVAGATLNGNGGNSLGGRATADDAMIPANKNGRLYIYTIMIGRNELVGYSGGATQYAADIATFAAARKVARWDRIVLCTLLPSTLANFNTQRALFNAIVTAGGWAAGHSIDAICDMAADLVMGPDAAASNPLLYGDGTHPTDLGQTTLEPIYRATINSL